MMSKLKNFEIISIYSLEEAIEDGILAKLCDIRWNGVIKSYVATTHVLEDIGRDGTLEIWKEFVEWRVRIMPTLPEEDQLFYTGVDGRKVWIIEDNAAYTIVGQIQVSRCMPRFHR
jgi:hypothetical protein